MSSGLQGRRIAVIGNSGSGKSTLAKRLSCALDVPHIELDALNWGPGWSALSIEEPERWARVVAERAAADAWVSDGNYSKGALSSILPRASDVVWLDYARSRIMARVLRRSLRRALSGQELWPETGNREDFRRWLRKDHPIRWTWDSHRAANARREALFDGPALAHARKHRFRTPRETQDWFDALETSVT